MKRNWGIPQRETVTKLRPLFPWSLFLVVSVILLALASCGAKAYDNTLPPMIDILPPEPTKAPAVSWADWSCDKLRVYMTTHTEDEARAQAIALHLPQWLIRKAERCPL